MALNARVLTPPTRRFWICRAEGGAYISHFQDYEVIGLAHIDKIGDFDPALSRTNTTKRVAEHFKDEEIKDRTATNHINQILHFIFDAQVGDLVLSVSSSSVYIGRIVSAPFFKREVLITKKGRGKLERDIRMAHFLRRKVKWITSVSRLEVPHHLQKGISAQQAFYNLDGYEDDIYSLISPYVYKNGGLRTNLLIKNENHVSTYHFSKLTTLLLKANFVAEHIEDLTQATSLAELDQIFEKYISDHYSESTLVAEFASPGRTSFKQVIDRSRTALYISLMVGALGGVRAQYHEGQLTVQENAILGAETRDHIAQVLTDEVILIVNQWLLKDAQGVQQHLELRTPGSSEIINEIEKTDQ